jgi:hypothetical protein
MPQPCADVEVRFIHDSINSNNGSTPISMNMHIHSARTLFGWMLGISAVLTLALSLALGLSTPRAGLASVTGRVNLDGQPVGGVLICFDSDDHAAHDSVGADGSFQLATFGRGKGVVPGKYRVHLFAAPGGPQLPSKYQVTSTSGLDVEVAPDWNDFSFDLR